MNTKEINHKLDIVNLEIEQTKKMYHKAMLQHSLRMKQLFGKEFDNNYQNTVNHLENEIQNVSKEIVSIDKKLKGV